MAIASMTGYARAEGSDGPVSFVWEARSVNGRTLETRLRVPPGYERLEHQARTAVAEAVRRGSVSVSLQVAERRQQQQQPLDFFGVQLVALLDGGGIFHQRGDRGVIPQLANVLAHRMNSLVQPPAIRVRRCAGVQAAGVLHDQVLDPAQETPHA